MMRKEHPRPQFFRKNWINLNGQWTCDLSKEIKGFSSLKLKKKKFSRNINVPFCPESELSGIGHTDFIQEMWYQKKFILPLKWTNKKILLNFGAVDYQCEIFVNQIKVGKNIGGSTPFTIDISKYVFLNKTNDLKVYVIDKRCPSGIGSTPWYFGDGTFDNEKLIKKWTLNKKRTQPRGKQSPHRHSWGCFYTRTTGIWQTVWIEAVNKKSITNVCITSDINTSEFIFSPEISTKIEGSLKIDIYFKNKLISSTINSCKKKIIKNKIKNAQLWTIGKPNLYKIIYLLYADDVNKTLLDRVESYSGMREIKIVKSKIYLNKKPLYQRLILDQGFYPKGIWTAPSDSDLKNDIILSMNAGFNGARLHEKVFESRFHYWADKLGYITWAEFPNWGMNENAKNSEVSFMREWPKIVNYLKNHPSIITWTPFNETNTLECNAQHKSLMRKAYAITKKIDPTRPVNETSGYQHQKTDIWTVHNYQPLPVLLKKALNPPKGVYRNFPQFETSYKKEPYIIDEYGGVWWLPLTLRKKIKSWGHGDAFRPKNIKEVYSRMKELTKVILETKHIQGFCYTQLTDVEQETNGIYFYNRKNKFTVKKLNEIFKLQSLKIKKNYIQ